MPPKVRELIAQLERAGFVDRGGKGSHRNYVHPRLSKPITISGKLGDDAKQYQIRAVRDRTPVFEPRLMWGTEHIMHSTAVENCTLGGS
jgi:predicted RNA binding protein YcfA (HicA-like mRNA interferase family)